MAGRARTHPHQIVTATAMPAIMAETETMASDMTEKETETDIQGISTAAEMITGMIIALRPEEGIKARPLQASMLFLAHGSITCLQHKGACTRCRKQMSAPGTLLHFL